MNDHKVGVAIEAYRLMVKFYALAAKAEADVGQIVGALDNDEVRQYVAGTTMIDTCVDNLDQYLAATRRWPLATPTYKAYLNQALRCEPRWRPIP